MCNSEWQAPSGQGRTARISGSGHFRQFSRQGASQRAREGPGGTIAAFGEASHLGACLLHHTPSLNSGFAPEREAPRTVLMRKGVSGQDPEFQVGHRHPINSRSQPVKDLAG